MTLMISETQVMIKNN